MSYTPEQRHIIALALRLSRGDPRRVRKSLLEALAVESSFRNLPYGDRDSEGVLQQRPSTGWGPASESAKRDIRQYLARANALFHQGFRGSAGALAQAIQRSAFPDRYDEHGGEAGALLRGSPSGGGGRRRGRSSLSPLLALLGSQVTPIAPAQPLALPDPRASLASLFGGTPESRGGAPALTSNPAGVTNADLVAQLAALRARLMA